FTPGYWLRPKHLTRGMRVRLALEDLGPIFVKFGQILSTRRDLLPDDVALELAKLQDKVKPFHGDEARHIIELGYGKPLSDVFSFFDTEPMAAASIAQVHAAQLHDGRKVVVKVVRPGIAHAIQRDIEILYLLGELANRYWTEGKRLRPMEVIAEFEKNLHDELDLMLEAANAAQLKRNFHDSKLLYVPEVEWNYTQRHVMVMERISGVPISDIVELKRRHVNLKHLAEAGVEIFFTQVFRDNFFHADMHPGNIFVNTTNPQKPGYIAVDFGIMGTLSRDDQHYLAENFLAFFHRDYRRVAELHVRSEWVPAETRIEEFEGAIRSVCEPIFDKPLKDISFGLLLLRLFQTARRFQMEVQPQLVLLQKTLLNIEGLGRQLYPELDLWQTAKPFLERWMSERVGWRAFVQGVRGNLPLWAEKLPDMPMLLHDALAQRPVERAQMKNLTNEIKQLRHEVQHQHQRNKLVWTGSTLLLCASLILALESKVIWNMPVLATLFGIIGSVLLLLGLISSR
ncbi:MAG: ubiquinone biosynthesis regulatory protein kinase UbiB, partial [Thiotrichaceae bacterium]